MSNSWRGTCWSQPLKALKAEGLSYLRGRGRHWLRLRGLAPPWFWERAIGQRWWRQRRRTERWPGPQYWPDPVDGRGSPSERSRMDQSRFCVCVMGWILTWVLFAAAVLLACCCSWTCSSCSLCIRASCSWCCWYCSAVKAEGDKWFVTDLNKVPHPSQSLSVCRHEPNQAALLTSEQLAE